MKEKRLSAVLVPINWAEPAGRSESIEVDSSFLYQVESVDFVAYVPWQVPEGGHDGGVGRVIRRFDGISNLCLCRVLLVESAKVDASA
jgi:hypothetical protein